MYLIIAKYKRHIAIFFILNIVIEVVSPTAAMALTSGPAQPEAASFEPVGTTDMVDPFSGDFNYNIPLLDVDGYPINISYHSGISMDQEASWVGLGWNINPGSINRSMRGLPDDFNGDIVKKEFNTKDNISYGINMGVTSKLFGLSGLSGNFGLGVAYNNYTGYNFIQTYGISLNTSASSSGQGALHLGLSSSADGADFSPSISFSKKMGEDDATTQTGSASLGMSFNSRSGMKSLSLNANMSESSKTKVNTRDGSSSSRSGGASSTWSFAKSTFVPQYSFPYKTYTFGFGATVGGVVTGWNGSIYLNGSYSKQKLKYNSEDIPAFGYLFSQNGQDLEKVIHDFNREKDGAFTENTSDLPLTNYTYDVFAVTGQGVGGSYRPFRNDIGYVHDSRVTSDSENDNISGEIHLGNAVHGDIDYYHTSNDSYSSSWIDNNNAAGSLKFSKKGVNDIYENVYFKESGEKVVDESSFYEDIHSDLAMRIPISQVGKQHLTSANFESENSVIKPIVNSRSHATGRVKRNQYFQYITYGEYEKVALQKSLKASTTIDNRRIYQSGNPDHIAEITTIKTDGSRYVYGIPAYNVIQEEASFSINGSNTYSNGTISFNPGVDDSKNNSNGVDNFYTKTTLPSYPYSYLLTAVLSPDYVDVTGNGPTDDDLGNYTSFSYLKTSENYSWRTPFGYDANPKATYDKGLHSVTDDDKASYVKGTKEIWYLSQITTKNHVAIFNFGTRKDGFGSKSNGDGIDGTISNIVSQNQSQRFISDITLYSKPDFALNSTGAFVLKKVNFLYDYSLCSNVSNNNGNSTVSPGEINNIDKGKLTLKQIFFTAGSSKKGQLSPYKFEYHTTVNNSVVNYDRQAYDRWGNYKPNGSTPNPENSEFPYTNQDKSLTDEYAKLWNLKKITLPSGGKIEVDLESDEYAYVQNKKAMQMFKVVATTGINPASASSGSIPLNNTPNNLFTAVGNNNKAKYYLFKLSQSYSNSGDAQAEVNRLVSGVSDLYFRFYVNTNSGGGSEYISGYTKIVSQGKYSSSSGVYDYGYIEMETTGIDDNSGITDVDFSPVTKATWQFARLHTPRISYAINNSANPNSSPTSLFQALKSSFTNIIQTFQGANGALANVGVGKTFDTNKSWIRLNNPNGRKLGGGCRVTQIRISDEWGTMLTSSVNHTAQSFNYGQEYFYDTVDNTTDLPISSGVASYEPSSGADENPFKVPVFQQDNSKRKRQLLAPDDGFYLEEPFGESFFPAPSIGYSRILVRNLKRQGVNSNATGYVVNEFYTAKDFPTKASRTLMLPKRAKDKPLFKIFNINFEDYAAASQGYVVELNDMHGKPKANSVYGEGQVGMISGIEYKYKLSDGNLNNTVPVITPNGTIKNANVGIDVDVVADFRESKNKTATFGLKSNAYFFFAGIFPIFVPPIIPSVSMETTRFRSSVVTKVVNKYGIMEETVVYDQSSKVATQNVLWDSETGEVALNKTTTEFNDDIYSFNYPSHWAYPGMGHAYKNENMVIGLKRNSSLITTIDPASSGYGFIVPGDELFDINATSPPYKLWVVKEGNDLTLRTDANTNNYYPFPTNNSEKIFKIIRSGNRNMQSVNVGGLTTFNNPVTIPQNNATTTWPILDQTYGVINASSVEFKENWNIFCNCGINANPNLTQNPYLLGLVGNWRLNKQHTFLSLRNQTNTNANSNIRKDGTFSVFNPFWNKPASGNIWTMNTTNWRSVNEVTEYSPYGFELENVDPLKRYSSAQYGYNNSLPVAVSSNARYRQMASEGFEDYDFTLCTDQHFGFKTPSVNPPLSPNVKQTGSNPINTYQKFSHTGRRSIKVTANNGQYELVKPLKKCSSN